MRKLTTKETTANYHGNKYSRILFICDGTEIAKYDEYRNTLYLKTDIIGCNFAETPAQRANKSQYNYEFRQVFKYVYDLVKGYYKVSEYTNA